MLVYMCAFVGDLLHINKLHVHDTWSLTLRQGCTIFSISLAASQYSGPRRGDIKPYPRRDRAKFSCHRDLATGICVPLT